MCEGRKREREKVREMERRGKSMLRLYGGIKLWWCVIGWLGGEGREHNAFSLHETNLFINEAVRVVGFHLYAASDPFPSSASET